MPGLFELIGPYAPVPHALAGDRRVTPAHALTYGALVSCLDRDTGGGTVYLRRIVERSWRGRTTVKRHLADLEAWGYVVRYPTRGRPTRYQLVRLLFDQQPLELEGPYPVGVTRPGTRSAIPDPVGEGDPAGIPDPNRVGDRARTAIGPRFSQVKTGEQENENPNGKPDLEGWAEAIRANPWPRRKPAEPEATT